MTEIPPPEGTPEREEERAAALTIARGISITSVALTTPLAAVEPALAVTRWSA